MVECPIQQDQKTEVSSSKILALIGTKAEVASVGLAMEDSSGEPATSTSEPSSFRRVMASPRIPFSKFGVLHAPYIIIDCLYESDNNNVASVLTQHFKLCHCVITRQCNKVFVAA